MRYGGAYKIIEARTTEQVRAQREAHEARAQQREAARRAREEEQVARWALQRAGPYTPTRAERALACRRERGPSDARAPTARLTRECLPGPRSGSDWQNPRTGWTRPTAG